MLVVSGARVVVGTVREAARHASKSTPCSFGSDCSHADISSSGAAPKHISPKTMTLEEARKILNVDARTAADVARANFERGFHANERGAGGTFYLQSKFVRAWERLQEA